VVKEEQEEERETVAVVAEVVVMETEADSGGRTEQREATDPLEVMGVMVEE
jgi:hypothetical protein